MGYLGFRLPKCLYQFHGEPPGLAVAGRSWPSTKHKPGLVPRKVFLVRPWLLRPSSNGGGAWPDEGSPLLFRLPIGSYICVLEPGGRTPLTGHTSSQANGRQKIRPQRCALFGGRTGDGRKRGKTMQIKRMCLSQSESPQNRRGSTCIPYIQSYMRCSETAR